MLCWELWTVLDRPELTPEALAERERQREWMRGYIRGLPESEVTRKNPQYSHEAQIARLEKEVFDHPLSPYFYDPMSEEEFAKFTKQLPPDAPHALGAAAISIFVMTANVRTESLQKRWPPGFLTGAIGINNMQIVAYRPSLSNVSCVVGQTNGGKYDFVDLAAGQAVVPPPQPPQDDPFSDLDAQAKERSWDAEQKGRPVVRPNDPEAAAGAWG